jgi:hypothetical protein
MRTSFRHQSEAQPPNGPLTAAASPDTPSHMPSHAVRPLCAMSPEALHRRQGQLFRSARIDISVAWHLSAKEKPARRSNLTGRAGLATTRRVVVSSMAILPTGRVSVESIEVLWSLRKAPLGAGLKESSGATPPPVLIC